jgi:hypothetical protein
MSDITYEPLVYGVLTIADTAVGFATADLTQNSREAKAAFISVEDAPVRFRVDGGNPTTLIGHPVVSGYYGEIVGINALKNFRAIRSTGVSASLKYTLYF